MKEIIVRMERLNNKTRGALLILKQLVVILLMNRADCFALKQ